MRSTLVPSTVSQAPPFTIAPQSPGANTRPGQPSAVMPAGSRLPS